MKNAIVFLLLFSLVSYAQEENRSVSAHFGYGYSNKLVTQIGEFNPAFNAGIEVRRRIGESAFHWQTGIRWNEYGFQEEGQDYIWNGEYWTLRDYVYKLTHFYVTIPLIATYKFEKIVPGLTLSAGPQISIYTFTKSGFNNNFFFNTGRAPIPNLGVYSAIGYEHNIGAKWIIGGEVYSNLNLPITSFFGSDGNYNLGVAISGRYILN